MTPGGRQGAATRGDSSFPSVVRDIKVDPVHVRLTTSPPSLFSQSEAHFIAKYDLDRLFQKQALSKGDEESLLIIIFLWKNFLFRGPRKRIMYYQSELRIHMKLRTASD